MYECRNRLFWLRLRHIKMQGTWWPAQHEFTFPVPPNAWPGRAFSCAHPEQRWATLQPSRFQLYFLHGNHLTMIASCDILFREEVLTWSEFWSSEWDQVSYNFEFINFYIVWNSEVALFILTSMTLTELCKHSVWSACWADESRAKQNLANRLSTLRHKVEGKAQGAGRRWCRHATTQEPARGPRRLAQQVERICTNFVKRHVIWNAGRMEYFARRLLTVAAVVGCEWNVKRLDHSPRGIWPCLVLKFKISKL